MLEAAVDFLDANCRTLDTMDRAARYLLNTADAVLAMPPTEVASNEPSARDISDLLKEVRELVLFRRTPVREIARLIRRTLHPPHPLDTVTTTAALAAKEYQGEAFLVDGLLPNVGLSMLFGGPGAGKSVTGRQLAVDVPRGIDPDTHLKPEWLGRSINAHGATFYAALDETNERAVANDLRAMGGHPDAHIHVGPMGREDAATMVQAALDKWDLSLVVIDTLGAYTNAEDIAEYSMRDELQPLALLAGEYETHIMLSHHSPVSDPNRPLGSQAIAGTVDVVIQLAVDEETGRRWARTTKGRDGVYLPKVWLDFDPETRRHTGVEPFTTTGAAKRESSRDRVHEYLQSQAFERKPAEIAKALGLARATVQRYLDQLRDDGLASRQRNGRGYAYSAA